MGNATPSLLPSPGLIGILFSFGCFAIMLLCCLLFSACYRCCLDHEDSDLNSTISGFRRRRRGFAYRDTVTAPAVMFTKKVIAMSKSIDDQIDQEEETHL